MHELQSEQKSGAASRRLKTIAVLGGAAMLLVGCENGHKVAPGAGGKGNPVQQNKDIEKVHLVWKGSSWKVKLNNDPNEQDPKAAETKIGQGIGPTMFEVDIQGSNPTPTFSDSGALQAWVGGKSNTHPAGISTTQILGPIVTDNGKTLYFFDLNQGDPVKISYSLSFKGTNIPVADPIIDNGGGTNRR